VKYVPVVAGGNCWIEFDEGLGDKNVGDGVGADVGGKVFVEFLRAVEPKSSPLRAFNQKKFK